MNKRLMQKRNEGGFTLIELLIVIVILGILAAIVVFAVGGITDRGATSACKSDVKTFEVASEAYFANNATYPATIAGMIPTFMHALPAGSLTVGNTVYTSSNGYVLTMSGGGATVNGFVLSGTVPANCTV